MNADRARESSGGGRTPWRQRLRRRLARRVHLTLASPAFATMLKLASLLATPKILDGQRLTLRRPSTKAWYFPPRGCVRIRWRAPAFQTAPASCATAPATRAARARDNSEFVGGDAPIECQAETQWCNLVLRRSAKSHTTRANSRAQRWRTRRCWRPRAPRTALRSRTRTRPAATSTPSRTLTQDISAFAARGPLRIAIPGDEPPYIATVKPGQDHVEGTSLRDGSIPRFFTQLLDEVGLRRGEHHQRVAHLRPTRRSRRASTTSRSTTPTSAGGAYEFRRRLSPKHVNLYVAARTPTAASSTSTNCARCSASRSRVCARAGRCCSSPSRSPGGQCTRWTRTVGRTRRATTSRSRGWASTATR